MYVNTQNKVANCRFGNGELPHCHQVEQVALRAAVASVLVSAVCVSRVEVHEFVCASGCSPYSLQHHFDNEGICLFGFDEA